MAVEEMKMCDKCPDQPAVAMYKWPWEGPGSSGFCSQQGQILLQQQAKNLKRTCQFLPLPMSAANTPLKRDERTRLIAEKLSAESEREETAGRNSELYQSNTDLSAEVKRLRLREAEVSAQLRDLKVDIADANKEAVAAGKKATEFSEQLQKAQVLVNAGTGQADKEIKSLKLELGKAKELAAVQADELSRRNPGYRDDAKK